MVRLDRRARALEADALDHVRVERPLEQPIDLALVRLGLVELGGLLLEHVDERVPDDLALLLRVLDALEAREEEFGRVDDGQVHAEVLVQHVVHLHRLVQAEYAIVDHDGMESSQMDHVRNDANARRPRRAHLSPMASCMSLAATVLSTPPLTAPITRPFSPQISRMRAISFPINSTYAAASCKAPITNANVKIYLSIPWSSCFCNHRHCGRIGR